MSTVTSSGDLSTIMAADTAWLDDALAQGFAFFDNHVYTAFDDFYYLDYVATIDTNTLIVAFLTNANGDATFTGSDMSLATGIVNTLDFSGDGGSFSFAGEQNYQLGEIGKWTFTSIAGMDGTEGFLMEGKLRLSPLGGVIGPATRMVLYTNGIEIEYLGNFRVDKPLGTYTNINVNDASGSFSLAGRFTALAFSNALDAAATFNDVLDNASLFSGGDTYTVADGTRLWQGFGGNDKMYCGAAADTLDGGAGNDTLDGGANNDTLMGGIGNDLYFVDSGADVIVEAPGGGTDTVSSSAGFDLGLRALNTEILILTGGGDIDATGNNGINTLTGNTGDNVLDDGAGADIMEGSDGNDTFIVDNAGDIVTDKSGIDTVESSVSYVIGKGIENLVLATGAGDLNGTGNISANSLTGNDGVNRLNGSSGNDRLEGGFAADILTGGKGADIFAFLSASSDGSFDTLADFKLAEHDKLDISDLLSAAGFIDGTSVLTDFVSITTAGADSILSVDLDGSGAGGFTQIALLQNVTALTDEVALVTSGALVVS